MTEITKSSQDDWKKIIIESNLFDTDFYLEENPDVKNSAIGPIEHYLRFGADEGRNPNKDFETNFYLQSNKDVAEAGINPFIHYILHGKEEGRIPNANIPYDVIDESISNKKSLNKSELTPREQFEYDIIEKGDINWSTYFVQNQYENQYADPIIDYIKNWNKHHCIVPEFFDTKQYLEKYPDIKDGKINPLMHFINDGQKEGRIGIDDGSFAIKAGLAQEIEQNLNEDEVKLYQQLSDLDVDWSRYFEVNTYETNYADPVVDYIKHRNSYKSKIPNFFDLDFYLQRYPDIKESGLDPLKHFIEYGMKEGRQAFFDTDNVLQGGLAYDADKETVVFVTHESSATGAPLLGYCIAKDLTEKYNVVHIVIKASNIHELFEGTCDLMLQNIEEHTYKNTYFNALYFLRELQKERNVKCVVINSIVGHHVLDAASDVGMPVLFLIHEFAEYMRPIGTMVKAVEKSANVVVPANIIKNSIVKEFYKLEEEPTIPQNIHIIPQGKLPFIPESYGDNDSISELYSKMKVSEDEDVKVVVASGWVQIRKGVDLFVATARYIKQLYDKPCKFVWVGEGFNPEDDLAYSVYLEREIEYSGLGDDFMFLGHQKNLDNIFAVSDVFCMSSRMDPFPNVVIDALSHDMHIACFEHGSGSAEFLEKHDANATIVDFVDTYAMAQGIVKYFKSQDKQIGKNLQIMKEHLDFDNYMNSLYELIDESASIIK